ncbi:DinB family protein [Paenibacillus albiflavus]|uniref:DinB family protein n=1 Tax=Paenibacillus albiflavus TaxID=2545760 RepID=A0A4V2WPV3_9BACL|nr:DinB family protein [Paenibacillus albiflavus]TCZ80902.1 DinB family protein [Paenibacillus albiflavus]
MSYEAVYPVWRAVRDRFQKTMQGLKEEELMYKLSAETSSIGFTLRHGAEVEYMFAEWFFNKPKPESVSFIASGPSTDDGIYANLPEQLAFIEASDRHLSEAMRELPEDAWDQVVNSPMGPSTPREALGRVLYHTGLHAGQIALIRKCVKS